MTSVLFLCTGNSCRSIMAEALVEHWGRGIFKGYSAGSFPTGEVHPLSLATLEERGIHNKGYHSKSWNEIRDSIDIVITVCDAAAGESCPIFSGAPVKTHWPVVDPAKFQGTEEEVREEFSRICDILERRVQMLIHLPVGRLSKQELIAKLDLIGTV